MQLTRVFVKYISRVVGIYVHRRVIYGLLTWSSLMEFGREMPCGYWFRSDGKLIDFNLANKCCQKCMTYAACLKIIYNTYICMNIGQEEIMTNWFN